MIRRYRHKPEPHFHLCSDESLAIQFRSHPDGLPTWDERANLVELDAYKTPFYGVELEVESLDDNHSISTSFWKCMPQLNDLNFYVKTDSSLRNGLEFVSHPRTYKSWLSKYQEIKNLFNILRKFNISGDKNTCGFHVHVGYDAFMSVSHIAKFIKILCEMQPLLMAKEGRTVHAISNYCIPVGFWQSLVVAIQNCTNMLSSEDKKLIIPETSGADSQEIQHHSAISITQNTIEIRLFKGTTSPLKFYRSLALLESIRIYSAIFGFPKCNYNDFYKWLGESKIKLFNIVYRKLRIPLHNNNLMVVNDYVTGIVAGLQESKKEYSTVSSILSKDIPLDIIVDYPEFLPLLKKNIGCDSNYSRSRLINLMQQLIFVHSQFVPRTAVANGVYAYNYYAFQLDYHIYKEYTLRYISILSEYFANNKTDSRFFSKFNNLSDTDKDSFLQVMVKVFQRYTASYNIGRGETPTTILKRILSCDARDCQALVRKEIFDIVPHFMSLLCKDVITGATFISCASIAALVYKPFAGKDQIEALAHAIYNQSNKRLAIINNIVKEQRLKNRRFRPETDGLIQGSERYEEDTKECIYPLLDTKNNISEYGVVQLRLMILWTYIMFASGKSSLDDRETYPHNKNIGMFISGFMTLEETKACKLDEFYPKSYLEQAIEKMKPKQRVKKLQVKNDRILGWPSQIASSYIKYIGTQMRSDEALRRAIGRNTRQEDFDRAPRARPRILARENEEDSPDEPAAVITNPGNQEPFRIQWPTGINEDALGRALNIYNPPVPRNNADNNTTVGYETNG